MILATVNTGSYDWTALAATVDGAETLLLKAYAEHARLNRAADPQVMKDCVSHGDITFVTIATGVVLRDHTQIIP